MSAQNHTQHTKESLTCRLEPNTSEPDFAVVLQLIFLILVASPAPHAHQQAAVKDGSCNPDSVSAIFFVLMTRSGVTTPYSDR